MQSSQSPGNLSTAERGWSVAIGTALPLLFARRGAPILSTLAMAAGIGFIARAVTGQCAVKAAMTGDRPMLDTQGAVEESADPQAVQEGDGANGSLQSSSGAS